MDSNDTQAVRTAAEAGWHVSRYNVAARVPNSKMTAIYNTFKRTCAAYTPIELYLMSVLDEAPETHPLIERLARRGVIVGKDHTCVGQNLWMVAIDDEGYLYHCLSLRPTTSATNANGCLCAEADVRTCACSANRGVRRTAATPRRSCWRCMPESAAPIFEDAPFGRVFSPGGEEKC